MLLSLSLNHCGKYTLERKGFMHPTNGLPNTIWIVIYNFTKQFDQVTQMWIINLECLLTRKRDRNTHMNYIGKVYIRMLHDYRNEKWCIETNKLLQLKLQLKFHSAIKWHHQFKHRFLYSNILIFLL